jgi:hypothetical protein
MNTTNQPFWRDEPDKPSDFSEFPYSRRIKLTVKLISISTQLTLIFLIAIPLAAFSVPLAVTWLIGCVLLFGFLSIQRRKAQKSVYDTGTIQELAHKETSASHMGSAIHVAGHPLLQRDQQVVLALAGDQLNVYSYENSTPIDSIPLKNIQGIYTVSYDDDRVPHIDAIDSVAQALQLTFLWREQPCTCLFRRMRKMKSIDWYHAIQQVRLQSGLAK